MSRPLIESYYSEVDRILQYGGSKKETTIRTAFQKLLDNYCKTKDLVLITELDYRTKNGKIVFPDGTVKDALRLDWGYWESKDEDDSLEKEIEKKFDKGYPNTNILFEDSQEAILYQEGIRTQVAKIRDEIKLDKILTEFINYERPEVKTFHSAIGRFKEDIPTILDTLRSLFEDENEKNKAFVKARNKLLNLCKDSINPYIEVIDVREMLIQHILTEEIFSSIFNEAHFHRENTVSKEIQKVIDTFFTGDTRRKTLAFIDHYYLVIKAAAANINNHNEKQKFLKVLYENFYKAYNPKGADRLGIVYTPNEIVKFMVESTDYLLHKHFGKLLSDKNVEILDPATGTGTFITELIEHIPKDKLAYKYKNEIHCNELSILPYYIANLNIEFTYKQKMGTYEEFKNICFMDTLDNMGFDHAAKHGQQDLMSIGEENIERIKRQNEKKISVIIGNPPYNANQQNENDNNKNREYPKVDQRIKDTYIAESTAQKTKQYDMYKRFFRWASDRIDEYGIVAMITNRSFIDKRQDDGFRKVAGEEFSEIYMVDLGGDVRMNPKLSGTKHNVFGIQTGVAVSFLIKIKSRSNSPVNIYYTRRPEMDTKEDKLHFLSTSQFQDLSFDHIQPDEKHNWINLSESDFESLIPVANKETKFAKKKEEENAVFRLFSLGVVTARDEWVYAFDEMSLTNKVLHFMEVYNDEIKRWEKSKKKIDSKDFVNREIKWTEELERYMVNGNKLQFEKDKFRYSLYRPFVKQHTYFDKIITHRLYQQKSIFTKKENLCICISGNGSSKPFQTLIVNSLPCFDFLEKTQCLPLYTYDEQGQQVENITDWGLTQFQEHYKTSGISKEDIFYYTYAVLHNPEYRKTYEIDLKRDFPRLPFYNDFPKWVTWGKQLAELHLNYESITPYKLKQIDSDFDPKSGLAPKAKLKANKDIGEIELDEITTLKGIPKEAWTYKLGNRSALEWILDQYKEKTPKDPTIREKFNTYRFADYKDKVIDLLKRVCTVSVETMTIVAEMERDSKNRIKVKGK